MNTKKKILIFIDWYLPGYKAGGPIQSISNLVAHLKDEFDFFIVTRDTDYCEVKPYATIKSDEWNVLPDGTSVFYFSKENLSFKIIKKIIQSQSYDFIYLNGIFSIYFTIVPLIYLFKNKKVQIIVAARGMFAEGALNVKKAKKQLFIRIAKTLKLFGKVTFHATNENEKADILKVLGNKVNIKVAGNLPSKNSLKTLHTKVKEENSLRLINVARISPEKNLLYALQVLKDVKSTVAFDFYGPIYNQEYWTECKLALDQLPVNVKANYKGSLPADEVAMKLTEYHFLFMPTLGENFGHIILQSLAAGCPVIISDLTPWDGVNEKNAGWSLSLNNAEKFIEVINRCVRLSSDQYQIMSENAFNYAKIYLNNKEITDQNKKLFN